MDHRGVLDLIKAYVKEAKPDVVLDHLEQTPVKDILIDSLDMTEFLMEMEDELGLTSEAIDLDQLGPKLAQNPTFGELANEILQYVVDRDPAL